MLLNSVSSFAKIAEDMIKIVPLRSDIKIFYCISAIPHRKVFTTS